MVVGVAIVLILIGGVTIATRIKAQREDDRRVDELYCTLSGVMPWDRGPKTGELCADLL